MPTEHESEYYQYTVDAGFLQRTTRLTRRRRLRNPLQLGILALTVALLAYHLYRLYEAQVHLGYWPLTAPSIALTLLLVAILWFEFFGIDAAYRRTLARAAPVGSSFGIRIGENELELVGPHSRSSNSYALVRGARREHGLVVVEFTSGYRTIFPDDVVPQAAVDRINALVASAKG